MRTLNFLEVKFLVEEIKGKTIKGRLEQIYQKGDIFYLAFRAPGVGKNFLKIKIGAYAYLTKDKEEIEDIPNFCSFLRKVVKGAPVLDVYQLGSERIIVFVFPYNKIYVEFFGGGNLILTDEVDKILAAYEYHEWKDRAVKKGIKYVPPPSDLNLYELSFEDFHYKLLNSDKRDIVRALAVDVSLGGLFSEEICLRAGVEKNKKIRDLSEKEFKRLYNAFLGVINSEKNPALILDNGTIFDFQAIDLEFYKNYEKKYFSSLSEVLSSFYQREQEDKGKGEKYKNLIAIQLKYLEDVKKKAKAYRESADFIYQHLYEIENVIRAVKEEKKRRPLEELKKKYISDLIKEVSHDSLTLSNGIVIPFSDGPSKVANELYKKAKKLESKEEGILRRIEELKKEEKKEERKREILKKKRKKEWYEKFHWMITSNGRLFIAGRDADQNEKIIRKHVSKNDIIFHAEIPGSPFGVLRDGQKSTEKEKIECANFVLVHSRAWRHRLPVPVYWVLPEQVSKRAPHGEYIKKGSFMIYGKKNYIEGLDLLLAIGIHKGRIVSGPPELISSMTKCFVVIAPGDLDKDALAKEVKNRLGKKCKEALSFSIEEFKEHLVNEGEVIEWKK